MSGRRWTTGAYLVRPETAEKVGELARSWGVTPDAIMEALARVVIRAAELDSAKGEHLHTVALAVQAEIENRPREEQQ